MQIWRLPFADGPLWFIVQPIGGKGPWINWLLIYTRITNIIVRHERPIIDREWAWRISHSWYIRPTASSLCLGRYSVRYMDITQPAIPLLYTGCYWRPSPSRWMSCLLWHHYWRTGIKQPVYDQKLPSYYNTRVSTHLITIHTKLQITERKQNWSFCHHSRIPGVIAYGHISWSQSQTGI